MNAKDSDFKQSSVEKFMEGVQGYSELGMTFNSQVKSDAKLLSLAKKSFETQGLSEEVNALLRQVKGGDMSPGRGTEHVFGNIYEFRSRGKARVYFRQVGDTIEILGYSNKKEQQAVINRLKQVYGK